MEEREEAEALALVAQEQGQAARELAERAVRALEQLQIKVVLRSTSPREFRGVRLSPASP